MALVVQDRARTRFDDHIREIAGDITDRLHKYEMLLLGGAGLFYGSEEVTRDEWRVFWEFQSLRLDFPNIQALGLYRAVDPMELNAYMEAIRASCCPDYAVWPEGERDFYTPVDYIEPLDESNRRARGFDAWSDPVRRAALERARETGSVALSDRITLAVETAGVSSPGAVMVLPLYRGLPPASPATESPALKGWLFAAFRVETLMQTLFPLGSRYVQFDLFSGAGTSPESHLFTHAQTGNSSGRAGRPMFVRQKTLNLYGQPWTFVFRTTPRFAAGVDRVTLWGILAGGLLISVLVFILMQTQSATLNRAHGIAQTLTASLRESESRLTATLRSMGEGVIVCDEQGRVSSLNRVAETLTGWSTAEAEGRPLDTVFRIVKALLGLWGDFSLN